MSWLHTWTGLVVGWVLFFVFATGTAAYFDTEIDRWMQPERPLHSGVTTAEEVRTGIAYLTREAPAAQQWTINPSSGHAESSLRVSWRAPDFVDGTRGSTISKTLDTATGEPVTWRETGGGQMLYKLHYRLHYVQQKTGYWTVGVCAAFMLVALITGIIVHKRIFKDLFTFRPGKGQRSWLDAHNVMGVIALPFHLMITYSGLVFYMTVFMPFIVSATYGTGDANHRVYRDAISTQPVFEPSNIGAQLTPIEPLLAQAQSLAGGAAIRSVSVQFPFNANSIITIGTQRDNPQSGTDQIRFNGVDGQLISHSDNRSGARHFHDTVLGLHEGLFAGPLVRWLYFLSGLLGTMMIGTGLVLWTVKRRAQYESRRGYTNPFGLELVERLNVGTITGVPIALAAYFWANRLIPVDLPERAAGEMHALFITLAAIMVYCAWRSVKRAWVDLFYLCGALYLLLPVINAFTTERHLGVTLPQGAWVLAGFDLTMLALGAAFTAIGYSLSQRRFQVAPRVKVSNVAPATFDTETA
jgi:uncharacterized iron-regulated membrane protein